MDSNKNILSDDELLNQFFEEQRQDIADNGFSEQVMKQLPQRVRRLSRIWSLFCIAVATLAFFLFDGWQYFLQFIKDGALSLLITISHINLSSFNLHTLFTISLAIILLSVFTIYNLDTDN
jgi:TRAP-type C4-dicarboxylate transport system permease small subunit